MRSIVFLTLFALSCSPTTASVPAVATAIATPEAPPPPPPPETAAQKLAKMDFSEAVAFVRPLMSDETNDTSKGALLFAVWGMQKMRWADVAVQKNETTFALVQKDPEEARGKRLCVSGMVVQIQVSRTDLGKVNEGLLVSDSGDIYNFGMVGDSGDLVSQSRARMCGVVIGRYDYSNSGGGTGHAIQLVGMFDLPENRGK